MRYDGHDPGVSGPAPVDRSHALSGIAVCFARAVNDTPNIAVLLLAAVAVGVSCKLELMPPAMTIRALLSSRKVAETKSKRITDLNAGEGLAGNRVTAALGVGIDWSMTRFSGS